MPLFLAFLGVAFLVSGIRGTHDQLISLVEGDFTGPNNFFYWILAIVIIGSFGYIDALKPLSDAFLVLVIVVLFLHNQGFFNQFTAAVKSGTGA